MGDNANASAGLARILLVDDDVIVLESLGGFLEADGYDVTTAQTIARAIDCLKAGRFALAISDVSMPESDGMELLRYVRAHHQETAVILITGYGTIEAAVEAIKEGAYDYLTKPIIDDDVRMSVRRALHQQELVRENRRLRQQLRRQSREDGIVGQDYRMARVMDLVDAVAPTRSTVLITGESGTGKTVVARAIHARSDRPGGPFVEVACGALPETLLESELFGHMRGSFTGAIADKPGKFAAADGGTIFLDEISSASPQLQVKLLRVLEERRFEPVGSNRTQEVDARVVLATNRDLAGEVQAGRFRADLYYRINVVAVDLPPLRERIGDIPLLAEHFLDRYGPTVSRQIDGFAPAVMDALQRYDWPGNVRELENAVERAVVLCRSGRIGLDDLPPAVIQTLRTGAPEIQPPDAPMALTDALAGPEKQIILAALRANRGSRQATARQLGINRTTLYKKMRKFQILDWPARKE